MANSSDFSQENAETKQTFDDFRKTLDYQGRIDVLNMAETFSKEIYQAEIERENSILQQASNMQGAFSFVTAGLFVIAEIVTDNKGEKTPYLSIIIPFCIITLFLLASLLFATLAQERKTKDMGPPSIEGFLKNLTDQKQEMKTPEARSLFTIKEYNGFYSSLRDLNEKRISKIKISMALFYFSLGASFLSAIYMLWADWYYNLR